MDVHARCCRRRRRRRRLPGLVQILDAAWTWEGLCMYGHGMFIPVGALSGCVLETLQEAAQGMTSDRCARGGAAALRRGHALQCGDYLSVGRVCVCV